MERLQLTCAWVALLAACAGPGAAQGTAARYPGPVIDVHAHLVRAEEIDSYAPGTRPGVEPLLEADAAGQIAVSGLIVMARKGDLEKTRAQNDEVKALAEKTQGRLFPVGSVHPDDGEGALKELERLKSLGFKLIKLHPNTQKFDVGSPALAAVVEKAGELGLVMIFDAFSPWDANETGKYLLLAVTHPKAKLILAHVGGSRFDEFNMFGMVRDDHFPWWPNNVWVDVSATAHFYAQSPYTEQLRWTLRKIGTDRVVFGSDWPVDAPGHAVADYQALGFTADEQRQIFCTNAKDLLSLPVDCTK